MQKTTQTVLLLGGMFGVGKSTLASQIKELYGVNCYNFDFADVYRQKNGLALSQSKQGNNYRDANWADTITGAINEGLQKDCELVIANSSFLIGARRRVVLERINQEVRKLLIILTPPLLVPYHRIKLGRPEGTHIVNKNNARESIHRICNEFIASDNTDLLLPTDPYSLPKEYLSMLCRNEANRNIIFNKLDEEMQRLPRWVLMSHDLSAHKCMDLIQSGIADPFLVRGFLEDNVNVDIESSLRRQ